VAFFLCQIVFVYIVSFAIDVTFVI